MAQLQKVSWRTVGYAALGTAVAAASVVAIVNRDGVRPTSLSSSSAARWLVDQVNHRVVLVDGLAGRVVAKIKTESEATDEVAVQGAGGAFLITPTKASVRTISTAKLQLGTAQTVATLSEQNVRYGVGESGLTIVDAATREARVVAVDDTVIRQVKIPKADSAQVAADGSMWLLSATQATHVNVDETSTTTPLRSRGNQTTTIGSRAVTYDPNNRVLHWLGGGDVSVASLPNATEAILQEPGDDAPCVWMASDDTLACVGPTGIQTTKLIASMHAQSTDKLGIAGEAAVLIGSGNTIDRIDLEKNTLVPKSLRPSVIGVVGKLTITAAGDLVWIDDQSGENAWVVHRFGINPIDKNDRSAPLLDAQGQVQNEGDGGAGANAGNGNGQGDAPTVHTDPHPGVEDPPVAVDDSVTARAGTTITVPVTNNDYDPDGGAIALQSVSAPKSAGHGVVDMLNGTSVSYVPEPGYSGPDSFSYTIVDESGLTDVATVNIQLFPADSPNRPPIATPDTAKTRINRPVTIDVLNNDVDPERDLLSIATIGQDGSGAIITDTKGPTQLPALRFTPPPGQAGTFHFTYQAADPQGGLSEKTPVTVEVLDANAENQPPVANPDSIRLRAGPGQFLDVLANDTDPDGDELTIDVKTQARGVHVEKRSQRLFITLLPGASDLSVIEYTLHDGTPSHDKIGRVLVVKIPDQAENRPPVANPDAERVVIGNSVRIPVIANDLDPDGDKITLLSVTQPAGGTGTAVHEDNFVRFTPNLPDITQPTPVTFTYRIGDGNGHEAVGTVNVTVLAEALPRAPFARDDFADTVVDKPVNIDVLTNDSDPSGGLPTLVGDASCPNGGTAIATDKQRIEFTPPAGQQGTFRCRYRVINPQGLTAEASIIVTVTAAPPGNQAPVIDDTKTSVEINVGETRTFNANSLANDPEGDSLVFTSVGSVEHGSISFNPKSATFTYSAPQTGTPDHTPTDDSIAITINDGHNGIAIGTIAVRILDPGPTPTATAPFVREITQSAIVGTPFSYDIVADLQPSNANVTLKLDSVSPDSTSPAAKVTNDSRSVLVTATESGLLNITYQVSNATGQTSRSTFHLNIADAPVLNPTPVAVDDALTVGNGGSGSVNLVANDRNVGDPGDVAQVTLVNRPPASFGTVTITNNSLNFVAAPSSLGGTATIQYTVSDGTSTSNVANIVITVEACTANPVSVHPGFEFTPYMTPINIDLSKYVESGTIIPESVQGAGLTGPVGTYTPPAGMNGVEQVTYTVTNACGDQVQGVLQIDVNRAPIGGSFAQNPTRGSSSTITVDQIASDDEPLSIVALAGNPAWVGIADPATILVSPPLNLSSGTYSFTATVRDPGGLTATATISLTVSNQPPTAVADAYFTGLSQLTFDPTVNDRDSEPGPLDIQSVSVLDGPGAVIDVSSPFVTVSLGHGVSTFNYTIADSGGLTDSSTITITSNHPPTMSGVTDSTQQPTLSFNLLPTDPDLDPVSVRCPNATSDLQSIVTSPNPNPSNPNEVNRVSVTVDAGGFRGQTSFTCDATDSFGAKDTATINLTFLD